MKTYNFPYIALALAATLFLVVIQGSQLQEDGSYTLPLLTLLVVSEFSFFVTAIAVYVGLKYRAQVENKLFYTATIITCLVFSIYFLTLGITLWPSISGA